MAGVGFLLKASLICYLCTTLALAHLSNSFFQQNGSTTIWINNEAILPVTTYFSDGSFARFILLETVDNLYGFGFCFHCKSSITPSCHLSIVFVAMDGATISEVPPLVVWSANRDQPTGENSVLMFFVDGGLVFQDTAARTIWSTGIPPNTSTIGIAIGSDGNLALLDGTNGTMWQSFDYPTDTLLLGQRLRKGMRLTSSVSSSDMGSGLFYLSIDYDSLSAYVTEQNNSQYLAVSPNLWNVHIFQSLSEVEFTKGNITFFYLENKDMPPSIETPISEYLQILRLDADGGLRIYHWAPGNGWLVIQYFSNIWDECQFPLKCGRYGVCRNGQCTCPVALDGTHFFVPLDANHPDHGCRRIDYLEVNGANDVYELRNFGHLSYFTYYDQNVAASGLEDEESCKEACLRAGTSCMAAFFLYATKGDLRGKCYLVSQVLSIIQTTLFFGRYYKTSSAYIKVKISSSTRRDHSSSKSRMLPAGLAACGLVLLCVLVGLLRRRKKMRKERLYLKKLSETLLRFSYSDLSTATQNFSQKVGGGGFGFVFKGTLWDGREVAVKRLGNDGQGKKEFVAEVETVGKIHHFNLVNLIGFCFENKHMIIVYEYVTNGSLEKWIFSENNNSCLDWELRKKIVAGIARGLAYIHEECVQRIAHLDVKPHNILLDDSFNAKLSDFGMSKLIDRDKSQVTTGMRGTLGYLAPEWRDSRITVKADVYSFGILVLEVISGRKVLDYSQPESGIHLLKLLKKKSLENRIMDIIDNRCEGAASNSEDVVHMIMLAMWCLHSDYKRRPTMSSVVKVLEGSLELETSITYNFCSLFSPPCLCSDVTASLASTKPL